MKRATLCLSAMAFLAIASIACSGEAKAPPAAPEAKAPAPVASTSAAPAATAPAAAPTTPVTTAASGTPGVAATATPARTPTVSPPQHLKADVQLGDIFIAPKTLKVASGGTLELTVTNMGAVEHNLMLGDRGTKFLNNGERETITFGPITGRVQLFCNVPGHREAGMVLDVEVT